MASQEQSLLVNLLIIVAVPKFNLRSTITLTPSPSTKQPHRKNTHRKTQSLQIDDEMLMKEIVQTIEKERSSSFDETPNMRYEGSDSEDETEPNRKNSLISTHLNI